MASRARRTGGRSIGWRCGAVCQPWWAPAGTRAFARCLKACSRRCARRAHADARPARRQPSHTLAARAIPGVRDALCAELRGANGALQRYVYVELAPGADLEPATRSIKSDPLFLDEETLILPVDSVATLEEEGHGLVIERWGRAGGKDHQRFLLEGRFDRIAIAGQMMASAARALVTLRPGAHPLDTIPPASLHPRSNGEEA